MILAEGTALRIWRVASTIQQGHGQVHQDDGGTMFHGELDRLAAGLSLGNYTDVGFGGEQGLESLAHNVVVIHKQDTNSSHNTPA